MRTQREQSVADARASLWRSRAEGTAPRRLGRLAAEEAVRKERAESEEAAAAKREAIRKAEAEAVTKRLRERESHLHELAAREEAKRAELAMRRERHAALLAEMEAEESRCARARRVAVCANARWPRGRRRSCFRCAPTLSSEPRRRRPHPAARVPSRASSPNLAQAAAQPDRVSRRPAAGIPYPREAHTQRRRAEQPSRLRRVRARRAGGGSAPNRWRRAMTFEAHRRGDLCTTHASSKRLLLVKSCRLCSN